MMRCRLKAAGIPLLLFCLGTLVTRAEGIGGNADSLKAIRLLTLSEKATDEHHAIAYALSSLSIGFRTKNHTVIAQSYRQLASCYRNVRAPQLLELDSLAVSYAAQSGDDLLYFDALQLIVKDFLNSNQTKKAALYLPLLDSIATLSNRHYSLSVASQLRSFYYYKKFQPRQALVYAQKSLAHALESTDRLLQVRLLSQVGQSFQQLMKRDSAAVYLYRALELAKEVGDQFELANIQNALGFLYQMSGDQERSLPLYRESIARFKDAGYPIEAAYAQLALSDVYGKLRQYDSVHATIAQAIQELTRMQNKTGQVLGYNYLGRYFSGQKQADSARHYFGLAKGLSKNNRHELLDFYINSYAAIAHYETGEHKRGDELVKKELARIGKLVPREIISSAIEMVAMPGLTDSIKQEVENMLLRGDTDRLPAQDSSIAGNIINPYTGTMSALDSLITLRQHEAVSRIDAQYRVRETRDSLLLARRDEEIARQKVSLRNQVLLFTGLLLLTLLFLLFLQRRHNKAIRFLKDEADHRISNTLTNIDRIIETVKDGSNDQASFDVLQERMAPLMVLYELLSSGTPGDVEMQSYFQIICEGLKQSYDHQNQITLEVDAALTMNGKTAGRVGLIVNELVTNAFKHAFTQIDSGKIVVTCRFISPDRYYLSVADNGTGQVLLETKGRGLQQVKELAWEIRATMNLQTNQGTSFEFYFAKA